jgi:hypothetical protein
LNDGQTKNKGSFDTLDMCVQILFLQSGSRLDGVHAHCMSVFGAAEFGSSGVVANFLNKSWLNPGAIRVRNLE